MFGVGATPTTLDRTTKVPLSEKPVGRKELYTQGHTQTPSTGLRHPSFGGRCRKAMLGVWATPTSDRATTVPQSVPFSEKPVGIRNELYTHDHAYNTRPDHHSSQPAPFSEKPLGRNEQYTQDHTYNTRLDHHSSTVRTTFRETRG